MHQHLWPCADAISRYDEFSAARREDDLGQRPYSSDDTSFVKSPLAALPVDL